MLVRLYRLHPYGTYIVKTCREGGDIHKVGGTGLELERQFGIGGLLEAHMRDHLPSPLVGRHLLKPPLLAVKHTYTRRAIHLVAREGVEIGVKIAHVHLHVRGGLRAVHKHWHTHGVGIAHHLLYGVHCAEHIGDMAYRHQTGALAEQIAVLLEVKASVGMHRHHTQPYALARAEKLPGHYVGVVLHDGEYYLVAVLHEAPETRGHEVYPLSGAAGENNL